MHTIPTIFALSLLALACTSAPAQAVSDGVPTPGKTTRLTGCVTRAADSNGAYVFRNSIVCAQLKGVVKPEALLGRDVTLEGLFTSATEDQPAAFSVQKQLSVAGECSATCLLKPPPTRGIHKQHPGPPASTDGVQSGVPSSPQR